MASKIRSTDDSVVYDIIIVGGGPIGLASAYECAVKRNMKVLLLEQFTFHNTHCSSPGYSRQWRICYSQKDLTELAIKTRDKWLQLIKETANEKLVKFTGVLWFGDSEISTPEGNISQAVDNLQALGEPYKYYDNAVEIRHLFPFIRGAVPDDANITALFLENLGGGAINVPELIDSLKKKLEHSDNCVFFELAKVEKIDYTDTSKIKITAFQKEKTPTIYWTRKVILTPGTYVNELLEAIEPKFEQRLKIVIYLWCSNYFTVESNYPQSLDWPVWIYFAPPKPTHGGEIFNVNTFYGFPSNNGEYKGRNRVAPAFTSQKEFNFYFKPPPIDNRPIDKDALHFTQNFVKESMPDLNPTLNSDTIDTCNAGFAENKNNPDDPGFVLDFLPGTDKRIVLCTAGWAMKFVPMFGTILADLALNGETEYEPLIKGMSLDRGVLVPVTEIESECSKSAMKPQAEHVKFFSRLL